MNALVTGGARGIEIARAFAHYDLAFGAAPSLDILVNNAGIGRGDRDASLQSGSEETVRRNHDGQRQGTVPRNPCRAGPASRQRPDRQHRLDFWQGRASVRRWLCDEQACAAKATPMGRLGQPDDIAGTVMMLCREEARSVTGNVIEAAGGLSI